MPAHGSRLIKLTGATAGPSGTITGIAGKCVDVSGGTADGTPITLWTCNGGANQVWTRAGGGFESLG
jgi:hypothetical protein